MKTLLAFLLRLASLVPCLAFAQPGSLDITFNPGTGPNGPVTAICLQTNGQILIAGSFNSFNGQILVQGQNCGVRLNSDGSLDASFNPVAIGQTCNCIIPQTNGYTLIGGTFGSVNGYSYHGLARLRQDGSVDTAFSPPLTGGIQQMIPESDGSMLVFGSNLQANGSNLGPVARINSQGVVDSSFYVGTGPVGGGVINTVVLESNGQILAGGNFTNFSGTTQSYVARLNHDGSIDQTFTPPSALTWLAFGRIGGTVTTLAPRTNNQVIISGYFSSIYGYTRSYIARLNADGSLDTTYNPGADGYATLMSVAPTGQIIVDGGFGQIGGTMLNGFCRLSPDDSVDSTFNPGSGPNGNISAVAVQPDGNIIIGGYFQSYNGTNINNIARINGGTATVATPVLLNPGLFMGMTLSGIVSNSYRIETTANLNLNSLWTPIANITLTNSQQFFADPSPPTAGHLFYRAVQLSQP